MPYERKKQRAIRAISPASAGRRGLEDDRIPRGGLASMMDNEPRFEGRSPEEQIFAIESEIENMMRSYEMAVADGDTDRAQLLADAIDKMEQMKMERRKFISREGDPMSPNLSMPNIYNYRLRKSLESGDPNIIRSEQRDIRRSAIRDMDMIQNSGMMQENPDYANEIMQMLEGVRGNYAEGGEAETPDMSEQEAMAELEGIAPQAQMIEQLIMAVIQMIQQGVSEAEVREFLKEQGLDDEDIEDLFMMVMQQIEQAPAEEPIGKELQGMM